METNQVCADFLHTHYNIRTITRLIQSQPTFTMYEAPFLPQLLPHSSLFPHQLPNKTQIYLHSAQMNSCIWFSDLFNMPLARCKLDCIVWCQALWLFVPCWPFSPRAAAPVYFYFKIDLLPGSRSRRARWQMFYCSITPSRVEYICLNLTLLFTPNANIFVRSLSPSRIFSYTSVEPH